MNAAAFLLAIARQTRLVSTAPDPLAAARRFMAHHGDTAEGQALRKVMDMLVSGTGEFAESDVYLFSTETLVLINALADARTEGRYSLAEWMQSLSCG